MYSTLIQEFEKLRSFRNRVILWSRTTLDVVSSSTADNQIEELIARLEIVKFLQRLSVSGEPQCIRLYQPQMIRAFGTVKKMWKVDVHTVQASAIVEEVREFVFLFI